MMKSYHYFFFFLLLLGGLPSLQAQQGVPYINEKLGIKTVFPKEEWVLFDRSIDEIKVLIYAPKDNLIPRFAILLMPQEGGIKSMSDRIQEVSSSAGNLYQQLSLNKRSLGGIEAEQLVYNLGQNKIIEFGIVRAPYYMIIQVAAPWDYWANENKALALEKIFNVFQWTGPVQNGNDFDQTSAEEIRKRRADQKQESFHITKHDIFVEVEPEKRSLKVEDTFTLTANENGAHKSQLYFSLPDIAFVNSLDKKHQVTWRWEKAKDEITGNLFLQVSPPLKKGQELTLQLKASADEYHFNLSQENSSEAIIWGQVNKESSFSSHIFYYPTDRENNAAVEMKLRVPKGYTAVGGGVFLQEREEEGGNIFSYQARRGLSFSLPFGFAIARYDKVEGKTKEGSVIEVYGFPQHRPQMEKFLTTLTHSASIFEELMGPLPFSRVAFAEVSSDQPETLSSLPGLILYSNFYAQKAAQVSFPNINVHNPQVTELFILFKEFSAQWLFSTLSCSHELLEGISAYANLLFVEKQSGRGAYNEGILFCQKTYMTGVEGAKDFAIANPQIFQSQAYRSIISCKTPVILDSLRLKMGDQKFFQAWKTFCSDKKSYPDCYEQMEKVFSREKGESLQIFFDQWFFQAGYPKIQLNWYQEKENLYIITQQTQKGPLFQLSGKIQVVYNDRQPMEQTISLDKNDEKHTFMIVTKGQVVEVRFAVEDTLLWDLVN